jgi:carbon storage regulator CsrA
MLIFSRRTGETTLAIAPGGECIKVTILDIRRNQVRIGVDASDSVLILRGELLTRTEVLTRIRQAILDGRYQETEELIDWLENL